jgi:hypothetical protein
MPSRAFDWLFRVGRLSAGAVTAGELGEVHSHFIDVDAHWSGEGVMEPIGGATITLSAGRHHSPGATTTFGVGPDMGLGAGLDARQRVEVGT